MFSGSIVALATPMQADGALDWESLEQLVDRHCEAGTRALLAVGTTGESATLDMEEHCQVVRFVVRSAAGRLPVIAGTGANSTHEAIALTRAAAAAGVAACLLVTPYYNRPSQEGLYLHYKAVAEAVEIPQILYNVPSRTACDLLPETVARLVELPRVVGVKETRTEPQRMRELVACCKDRAQVFSGDDGVALEAMLLGANGTISVTANVAPKLMAQMCAAALAGQTEQARALDDRLRPLHEALFLESNPIPVKWALQRMDWIRQGIRLPLTPLQKRYHDVVQNALQQAGVL